MKHAKMYKIDRNQSKLQLRFELKFCYLKHNKCIPLRSRSALNSVRN